MKIVYISGPMEGCENHNITSFQKMENYLSSKGYSVVNPFDILVDERFKTSEKETRRDYMRKDIREITFCSSIMMLNGWSRSHGAQLERTVAIEMGLGIMYEDELNDYE